MVHEKVITFCFNFCRKLRDNPSDILMPFLLILMLSGLAALVGWAVYASANSTMSECKKYTVSATIYVDPDTKEEKSSGEEKIVCTEWVSPVDGKIKSKKEK
jgi:hypothetical protein